MRAAFRLAAAAALLGAAAWLGGAADRARATPRPRGGIASLLGGLGPIVAQASWIRAEAALRERRDADALYHLGLITALEPHLVAARDHVAREIGLVRSGELTDATDRWSLIREGLRILDDTVVRNPRDPEAYLARARYVREGIARGPPVRELYEKQRGGSAIEQVGGDFDRVLELAPEEPRYRDEAGVAYVLLGQKRFFADGDYEGAAAVLRRARAIYEDAVERFAEETDVLEVKQRVLAMVTGLIGVAETPADRRREAYAELWDRLGAEASDLPPPAVRAE